MQQTISDSPLLSICVERHGFVIEADDLAATLPMLMIKETNGVADGPLHGGSVPAVDCLGC